MSSSPHRKPGLKFAANLSLLFNEWPMLDRFAAARDAGFDGVEIQFPYDEDVRELERAASRAGVTTVLINAPVQAELHPFGLAGRPEFKETFQANLQRTLEYAQALKVKKVNVLAGCSHARAERQQCLDVFVDNLLAAHEVLNPAGIEVVLEVLNGHDVPGFLLTTFENAELILKRCDGRVGLQFDVYHAAMMGLDPGKTLARLLPSVRHVQFADAPGRHEPGTGTVRFDDVWQRLFVANYAEWISAEYRPSTTTLASLGWLAQWRARF
jgi:hydroxypyruvate isomerase